MIRALALLGALAAGPACAASFGVTDPGIMTCKTPGSSIGTGPVQPPDCPATMMEAPGLRDQTPFSEVVPSTDWIKSTLKNSPTVISCGCPASAPTCAIGCPSGVITQDTSSAATAKSIRAQAAKLRADADALDRAASILEDQK